MLRPATRPALAILAVAVVLAGCQAADPDTSPVVAAPSTAAPDAATDPPAPSAAADPTPAPERIAPSEPAPRASSPATACGTADDAAIDAIIGEQLAAFASGDFAEALSLATPGFRGAFTPEAFEAMITDSFPVPASATGHVVLGCQARGTSAAATVLVQGVAGEQTLEYLLVRTGDGWLIDGAVPAAVDAEVV